MKKNKPWFQRFGHFSFYKPCEGGQSQRDVIEMLAAHKIEAKRSASPYIGQHAVMVLSGNQRIIKRAERLIYGK